MKGSNVPETTENQAPHSKPWKDGETTYHGPKPKYRNLGHHDESSEKFRGRGSKTTSLPKDAEEVYQQAIPTSDGRSWYGRTVDGEIYRYQVDEEGFIHFNGRENSPRGLKVPAEIRRRFRDLDNDSKTEDKK